MDKPWLIQWKLYYENVYPSECLDASASEDTKLNLENSISIEELMEVVQSMNSG